MKRKGSFFFLSVLMAVSLIIPSALPESTSAETGLEERHTGWHYWDKPEKSAQVLSRSSADRAGMVQQPLDSMDDVIKERIMDGLMPGAVVLAARSGHIVKEKAYGHAALYTDDQFTEMDEPVLMKEDTIFDVASISKLFTTTAVMMLYEQGEFGLDDPVAEHIPEFAENGKSEVTIKQLLTHTSGFTSGIPIHLQPGDRDDRVRMVLTHRLLHEPGTTYLYSDLNMITLGVLIERLSGMRQDKFVSRYITGPLGMTDTMYNPPVRLKDRIAATEFQANVGRGLVWGEVHDEKAWSMDGVAGHAGVFSTANDLAILGHAYLNEGEFGNVKILKPRTVRLIMENYNTDFPEDDHGLGWELNQGWYMDALAADDSAGHTGYTGTTMVISPTNQTIAILLTNRVHPSRNTPSINPLRRSVARMIADSIPVEIKKGKTAWFAGYGDELAITLTAKVDVRKKAVLTFDTWYEMEDNSDFGIVGTSEDGREWMVQKIWTGKGKWKKQKVDIPAGTQYIRFLYDTDATVNGRGWYVNNPQLKQQGGKHLKLDLKTETWQKRDY
ncbi:MAG: serine hydrolase [Bacillus sp. (in: firmicutes)]